MTDRNDSFALVADDFVPPIQPGEIYARCPRCQLIGWTADDDSEPMPTCPNCDVLTETWRPGDVGGYFDLRIIDGAPIDRAHHLGADPEPNLYRCPRCGVTIEIGSDDLAGDEDVVRQRIAHACEPARNDDLRGGGDDG